MAFRYINQSDPNATDSASNTGVNSAQPLRSIAASFSRMQPGDTAIVLDSSSYAEQLTCGLQGTAALPLTFRAETGVTPTLVGALNARWILQLNGAKYTVWDGFRFAYGYGTPDPPASDPTAKRGRFPWIQLVGATTQFNKLTNLTIQRAAFLGAAISGYAAAGWDEWGIQDSGARYTWIYKCTIGGLGQGVQLGSTDFFALVEDCDIGPTYQSCITCTSSSGQIAKRWIKNCRLSASYIEDGIQWIPASGAGVDQTTDKSNVGAYVSDTTIYDCNENGGDTKGARLVWFDRMVIYSILGSNNGLESGGNRNSHFGVGRGASTACSEITLRNSYLYDMPTVAMRGPKYSVYHNVIVNCNRDYTGSSGAYVNTVTPPFKSVFHQDGAISGIVANNILGKNATGTIFMRLGQGEFHLDGNMHVEAKPGNWTGSAYSTYSLLADWQAAVQAAGWATSGEAGAQFVANLAAVKFRSVGSEYLSGPISSYDLTLQSDSPAVGAGKYLQKAIGAGTNSRFLTVPYPSAFFDGFGWQGASFPRDWATWVDLQGDVITIKDPSGVGQPRQILNIDYDTGVVELDEAASWLGGAEIFLGSSTTPNLGPLQAGAAGGGGGGGGGTGSGSGRKISFRVNCQTSSGDQTIALPVTLTSAPKALLFTWNNGVTNGTAANHALLMRGAWVTGGAMRATCILSENGISGQDSARQSVNDACVLILTNANGVDGKATVSSVSTTQIVLNWSNPPASAFPLTITVFDCADAYLTSATLPTVTYNEGAGTGYVTVTPTFRAGEIHLWTEAKTIPGNSARAKFSEGWVSDDGSATRQCGFTYMSNDLASGNNTQVAQQMLSTSVLGELADSANALNRTIQVKNLDATSFRLASVVGDWSGGADAIVLAIRWDGLRTWAGVVDMPTSAVATTFGDPNFLGQHAELMISNLTAIDTLDQTGNAGTLAYWTGDGSRETMNAWSDKDNVPTSVTRSLTDDNLNTLQHDATAGYTATFTSFEGAGPKLTFTAVLGTTRKAILFLVGAAGGQATATDEGGGEDTASPNLIIQVSCTEEGSGEEFAAGSTGVTVISLACTEEGGGEEFAESVVVSLTTSTAAGKAPSFGQGQTLTFNLFEPLKQGTQQIDELGERINSYSHEIAAAGGFYSARLTLVEPLYAIDDWLETGLGRRLVVNGPENQVVWEGMVNRITVRLGASQRTIGPLLSTFNRVKLTYSYIAAGGTDIGVRATTTWADNLTSQTRYGVLSKVLSTGGATVLTAASLRDDYLQQNAYPETDGNLDFGAGGGEATLELELVGYYHYLQSYIVAITTTGTTTLSAHLQAILAQEPNNFLMHEWEQIAANTLTVPAYNNDDRDALSVIKTLIAKGDAADNRWIFGLYENRKPHYVMASQQVDYIQYLNDPAERIIESGSIVQPWDVRPGKWILNPDYLLGRVPSATALADDPRAEFVESVTFQLPYTVALRGSKIRRLDQKLARLGLSGLGG